MMMTPEEALQLLDGANIDRDQMSRVNPAFTRGQVLDIVRAGIAQIQTKANRPGRPLDRMMEKRVYQVLQNRRCPALPG